MADEISPDVAEAITASAPVKPKQKISIWAKVFAIVVIISMTGWVFAAYLDKGDNTDNSNNLGSATLLNITGYSIYALQDNTFGTFIKSENGTDIPIAFRLDPRNASNIPIDNTSMAQILNSDKVYVVIDPDEKELGKLSVAAAEISRIPALYGIDVIGAYTRDSDPPNPNIPIRNCNDASNSTAVIYLDVGNSTGIENNNGCIHVTGKNADELILAADKLGYNLVGIII